MTPTVDSGLRALGWGALVNLVLAAVKIAAGVLGNSYALIADGIESTTDIVSSLIVWSGLRISTKPADEQHPFGHGKAESLAAGIAALGLLAAAAMIAVQSIREILTPHAMPEWFTLPVLLVVIIAKELLFRYVINVGSALESTSLKVDAWHHRSDALTSAAVLIGVSISLAGGPRYAAADDWAALVACGVIAFNGATLLRTAVGEIMDATVPAATQTEIRRFAGEVVGVRRIEKMRVRKSGLGLYMDIHVEVDANMSVRDGHEVARRVKAHLLASGLGIVDVLVHIEPWEGEAGG